MSKANKTPDRIQAVWNIHGGEVGIDALLAGRTKIVAVSQLGELKKGAVIPARTKKFVPKTAFKTRKEGRWSSPNMASLILPVAKPIASVPEIATHYRKLETQTREWDIMKEYPESIYRDIRVLLAHMDSLTALQPSGEAEGDLLVENYAANLFFFVPDVNKPRGGFVFIAIWDSDGSKWYFSASPLDGFVWPAGSRVFSNC